MGAVRGIRALTGALLVLTVLAGGAPALRAEVPPAPARHFHDGVGIVPRAEAARLAQVLYEFEGRTRIQFVIAVLPELEGELSDTAARIYEAWGLGNRESYRGVLFLVFPREGKSRLEVGYGLEENLPDVTASRILREMQTLPSDPAAARFELVMRRVAQAVAPEDPLASGAGLRAPPRPEGSGGFGIPRLFLIILLFAILGGGGRWGRNRWLGPMILMSMMGGGRRGGFGGGGGFRGGGGFSGGGGASGGW